MKKVYTISELVELGYARADLYNHTRISGQTFATRNCDKQGSTWRFDLDAYKRFLRKRDGES